MSDFFSELIDDCAKESVGLMMTIKFDNEDGRVNIFKSKGKWVLTGVIGKTGTMIVFKELEGIRAYLRLRCSMIVNIAIVSENDDLILECGNTCIDSLEECYTILGTYQYLSISNDISAESSVHEHSDESSVHEHSADEGEDEDVDI